MLKSSYGLWLTLPFFIFAGIVLFRFLVKVFKVDSSQTVKNFFKILLLGIIYCSLLNAYFAAWNEKRVFTAFFELFLANFLISLIPFVLSVVAYWLGNKVYLKSSRKWLGYIVGILIFLSITFLLIKVFSEIPIIGERMEQIFDEREDMDRSHNY